MNTAPNSMGSAELAMRIQACLMPGAWFCLLTPQSLGDRAGDELGAELKNLSSVPVIRLCARGDAMELARQVRGAEPNSILMIGGFENFAREQWARMDRLRSWFERDLPVILVLSQGAFEQLMRAAPNFASWLGGSVWTWNPSADVLSPEEREHHLQALRERFGWQDGQVIEMAEKGELPSEPELAEWLVLLDRGDLLEHGAG